MRKLRLGATAMSLLMTLILVASARAVTTNFTTSSVTSPADPTYEFQNLDTNPNATITVAGTTNWNSGDTSNLFDIGCYSTNLTGSHIGPQDYHDYQGPSGSTAGIALNPDGSFSVSVPQSFFESGTCHLVVVPHGTSIYSLPAGDSGPRVGFSYFQTDTISSGVNGGTPDDYYFDDVTTEASDQSDSVGSCGPYSYLLDGTSAVNLGPNMLYCAGSLYGTDNSSSSEIQVDGQNAYGSTAAATLFLGSDALSGFPALTVTMDSFDSSNGNAQTTDSEPLVKCTPDDAYQPTSTQCTAFAPTGVEVKRVTDFTNNGRVATVTDTFTSTDGQAHSLALEYENDLDNTAAGWELPGQSSFTTQTTGATGPAASVAPGTVYAIYDSGPAPSLSNPVSALTFSVPYDSVKFDNTIWGGEDSALFDFTPMVPAGGSTSITWSYATGTTLAEVQGYAATAQAEMQDAAQPPAVAISSPANGATETSTPVTVTGTASAGSGVKSVTVNGVSATVSGDSWSASVPLTAGSNKLTATLTSDAGNTATATATVTYTPPVTGTTPPVIAKAPSPPQIVVKSRRFNGKAVLVKLACAAGGANCAGKITLRYTHTVVKHHKKHRVTVTIASRGYALAAGHTATISVGLNATGRRLLKAEHKLPGVKGTVALSGGHAKTFALTLKQPAKHKK